MASNPEIQELATEIDECAAGAFSGGRTNNLTDLALSIGAIAASAIAAILVADGKSFPLFTAFGSRTFSLEKVVRRIRSCPLVLFPFWKSNGTIIHG